MKKKVWIIIMAIFLVGIISIGAVKASRGREQGILVDAMTIEKGSITVKIPANGVLEEVEKEMIYHETAAKVKKVEVEEGDQVKKGQVLAILDTKDLTNNMEIAEKKLEIEKINLSKLQKAREEAIEKSMKALEEAVETLERNEQLYQKGAVSQLEYERSKKAFEEAEKTYNTFIENKDTMFYDIQQIEGQIQISQLNIEEMKRQMRDLTSGMEGIVTAVNIKEGSYINPTNPCFVISNLEHLEIQINVSEYDIAKVKVGQEVEIETDALTGVHFKGVVQRISPVAIRVSTGQSMETVVPVTIKVMENHEMLKPGFSVKTRIITNQKEDTLTVPFDAIITEQNGAKIVYVIENGTAKKVEVQTGIESDFDVEILKGLEVGDQIILRPSIALRDGMRVIVRERK